MGGSYDNNRLLSVRFAEVTLTFCGAGQHDEEGNYVAGGVWADRSGKQWWCLPIVGLAEVPRRGVWTERKGCDGLSMCCQLLRNAERLEQEMVEAALAGWDGFSLTEKLMEIETCAAEWRMQVLRQFDCPMVSDFRYWLLMSVSQKVAERFSHLQFAFRPEVKQQVS
jgi:hypothetical protein